jgi:acyl carrier protein
MEEGIFESNSGNPAHRVIMVVERLIRERSIPNGLAIGRDHKLVELGLTSIDLARLVLMVEDEFDLMIPNNDMIPSNFRSVATITDLVSKLLDRVELTAK